MALPNSIQNQADYADALEQSIQNVETDGSGMSMHDQDTGDSVEKLRNRYASLQGKYNAEVPRLQASLKDYEYQNQQLMEELNNLRGALAEQRQQNDTNYLTEKDADAYGEDMIDLIRRGVREESTKYADMANRLQAQVNSLENQMANNARMATQIREEEFYRVLTSECPQWEDQNTDEGFLTWLNEVDPVYGFQRNEALQRAFNSLDAVRVASIFNQYRDSLRSPLQRQVSPTTSRGQGTAASNGSNVWTNEAISRFYDAWRRKEITDEQAAAIEQEITEAVAQGKVLF